DPLDVTAARVEIAQHVAQKLFRRHRLDMHDRLEDGRLALAHTYLKADRRGQLERHLAGVDRVERAVEEPHLRVHQGFAGDNAGGRRLAYALLNGRDVLAWHRTADDLVLELDARATLQRLQLQPDVPVLALAAGLAHPAPLDLGVAQDRLAVGHLRTADAGFDLELPHHAVDDDLQ